MLLTEKLDIKVFILFLLKNVNEPLEYSTINDMVIQDDFVNYFDFSICFGELVESGQIEEITGDRQPSYRISKLGEEAVGNVEERLFKSVREKALRSAMRLLAFNKRGTRISSNITEDKEGYILTCTVENNSHKLLQLETFITEKYYAETLMANFNDRAETIYKGVLSLLSGDINYIFDE